MSANTAILVLFLTYLLVFAVCFRKEGVVGMFAAVVAAVLSTIVISIVVGIVAVTLKK